MGIRGGNLRNQMGDLNFCRDSKNGQRDSTFDWPI